MKKRGKKEEVVRADKACKLVCNNKILCWVPRVLAILYIVFISLFALDVFGEGNSLGEVFLSFIIHLIPSIILVVLLIVSWKCEKIGGGVFIVAGIIFTIFFSTYKDLVTFLIISGPVFLIGVLFWISAMKNAKK